MYCKNCGKFLLENDKFCSNCGTPVAKGSEDALFKSDSQGTEPSDETGASIPKPTPPVETIQWNLQDFPEHGVKKTEEINFDWGDTGIFKKPTTLAEEIALNPVKKTEEPSQGQGETEATAPEAEVEEETVLQGKDLEDEIFAEASLVESIPSGDDSHKKTTKVDKFYTFNKKNEEFQKLLDKEYDKIKTGDGDSIDEQSFRDGVQEINRKSDELWPEFNPAEHVAEMARARELFFGPDIPGPVVSEKKAEPKVENFESDSMGEEPLPESEILPDLALVDAEEPITPAATETEEATTEVQEEMPTESQEEPAATETSEASTEPEPQEDIQAIRDRWFGMDEEEDEEKEKRHTGKLGRFLIVLLIIILIGEAALLAIHQFAGDSAVGKFVDNKIQNIVTFFVGENNASAELTTDRMVAAEDKTGLIQLQIGQNKGGAIQGIQYNGDLKYASDKTYKDSAIKESKVLESNLWYTKVNGDKVYYDEQAVGTVIVYESTKDLDADEIFQTLEIGEIRISGEDLYVWVAEEITPGTIQEKVLKITVSGETMAVVAEYDA